MINIEQVSDKYLKFHTSTLILQLHYLFFWTDSIFVHLKGKTKEEAFKIGQEIADKITELSPTDVVIKFEKVYLPSILISKKR